MPVRSIRNQYVGINAHLHSYWQAEGGWHNFHNRHIGDLAGVLRQRLLPTVWLPLRSGEGLLFDFSVVYRKSYEEMAYGLELVDYAELPRHFDRYTPADQTHILNRMIAVLDAAHQGADLEAGAPLTTLKLPMDAAYARLATIKS